jgi:hypothetical protein
VSEQENSGGWKNRRIDLRGELAVLFAAQEFVPFNGSDNAYGGFVAGFGALYAAQAAYANRASEGDLIGKRQENLHRRAFFHVFSEVKVDSARADVAGFGASFPNGCASGPTDRKGEPHGKALGGAAFRARQERTSSIAG